MIVVGIDPGLTGAIAILENGRAKLVFDMPIMKDGKTNQVDGLALYNALLPVPDHAQVILEQVHAMPGQGVSSMFTFGGAYHAARVVVQCLGLRLHKVTPSKWKRIAGLGKDKEAARTMAIELFPEVAMDLQRKKDAGRAEALLIAHYGGVV